MTTEKLSILTPPPIGAAIDRIMQERGYTTTTAVIHEAVRRMYEDEFDEKVGFVK